MNFIAFIAVALFAIGADYAKYHNEGFEAAEEHLLECVFEDNMDESQKAEKEKEGQIPQKKD